MEIQQQNNNNIVNYNMNPFQNVSLNVEREENSLDNCQILEVIGSGTYGVVYKAKYEKSKKLIAIKQVKIELEQEGIPSSSLREISILKDIKHDNIVNLYDVIFRENKLWLIFELLNYDLKRYLESIPDDLQLGESLIKSYIYQLLVGTAYCHSKKIIHRDLKPANLLINDEGLLKIADFGLARVFSVPLRPYTKEVLTLWYRAPEILLGCIEYTTAVDIWSIGCIFAELHLKKPLFLGENDIDQLFKIFRIKGTPNANVWPEVVTLQHYKKTFPKWKPCNIQQVIPNMSPLGIDLLNRLMHYDPNQRISAKQALNHVRIKFNLAIFQRSLESLIFITIYQIM